MNETHSNHKESGSVNYRLMPEIIKTLIWMAVGLAGSALMAGAIHF